MGSLRSTVVGIQFTDAKGNKLLLDESRVSAPPRARVPKASVPIVTQEGLRVHLVATRDRLSDAAITLCGLRIESDAEALIRCARGLSRPKPCRNCDRSER